MIIFTISFSLTIGTNTWVYSTEILNEQGMGIAVSVHWVINFIIFYLRNIAIFADKEHHPDEDLKDHTAIFFFLYSSISLVGYF